MLELEYFMAVVSFQSALDSGDLILGGAKHPHFPLSSESVKGSQHLPKGAQCLA